MAPKPSFALAGNAAYTNRGCEAIIRGTTEIINSVWGESNYDVLTFYGQHNAFIDQVKSEYNATINHYAIKPILRRRNPLRAYNILKEILGIPYGQILYGKNCEIFLNSNAVLSVGGDNYSLDYGIPRWFTSLDDYVLSLNKPLIIWGASIGPFSRMPDYEKYMADHLRKVTAIFVREKVTAEYLDGIGVRDNVYLVADPAFVMRPKEISNFIIEPDAIGLNFSPLMAKYTTDGDMITWKDRVVDIIDEVRRNFDNHIYLIPHVTMAHNDDYLLMKEVLQSLEDDSGITLIPPSFDSEETKWLISKLKVFAGARTHATIAALSTCVPTLSFSYSIKAAGINRDIYGHEDYCLSVDQMSPGIIVEKMRDLLMNNKERRLEIERSLDAVLERSNSAGKLLKGILG